MFYQVAYGDASVTGLSRFELLLATMNKLVVLSLGMVTYIM